MNATGLHSRPIAPPPQAASVLAPALFRRRALAA
jgi:hypothetical protein